MDPKNNEPEDYEIASFTSDPEDRRIFRSWMIGLILSAAACFILAMCTDSTAHDARPTAAKPNGWTYPFSCCSGIDCREVTATSVGETYGGYVIKSTGEVIAHEDNRIKNSPDGAYHLCCKQADFAACKPICLFVPPRAY